MRVYVFYTKNAIILPRQARDKHRERALNKTGASLGVAAVRRDETAQRQRQVDVGHDQEAEAGH